MGRAKTESICRSGVAFVRHDPSSHSTGNSGNMNVCDLPTAAAPGSLKRAGRVRKSRAFVDPGGCRGASLPPAGGFATMDP